MIELLKDMISAPAANVLILIGGLFVFIAVVGNIAGKIEPGRLGRVLAGVVGVPLIVVGILVQFPRQPDPVAGKLHAPDSSAVHNPAGPSSPGNAPASPPRSPAPRPKGVAPKSMDARTGTLLITASPAPRYFLDDEFKGSGVTTLRLSKVGAGVHRVRLDHPSYELKEFSARVAPDSTTTLDWKFQARAWITVKQNGDYWAWIWVDGEDLRIHTPRRIPVRPGQHTVRVEREGYVTYPADGQEVTVNAGQDVPLQFTVLPR